VSVDNSRSSELRVEDICAGSTSSRNVGWATKSFRTEANCGCLKCKPLRAGLNTNIGVRSVHNRIQDDAEISYMASKI
jgi:hypothetical protein